MNSVLNVDHWEIDKEKQVSGTRAKYWLIEPTTGSEYLFKIPKDQTGEVWAEKFAAELGAILGLKTMNVEIAEHQGKIGILAKNFRQFNEQFYEGGDLFFTVANDFNRYSLKYYNISNAWTVLSEFQLDRDFNGIPVFDALIANQDRHCDNWGILYSDDKYSLAPYYDNGSSLGFQLKEERISEMLINKDMFNAFTDRSYTLIGLPEKKKPKHLDLLQIIKDCYPTQLKKEIERLSIIEDQVIANILHSIPNNVMGNIHKDWIKKLILYRKEWLLNWYGGRF